MLSQSSQETLIRKPLRSPWRQRLIDAETGFRIGIRYNSTLFVYLFFCSIVFASGLVLNITPTEWVLITLTLGVTISVELFHQLLMLILQEFRDHLRKDVTQMLHLGTAAVVTINVTAAFVICILIGGRMVELIF